MDKQLKSKELGLSIEEAIENLTNIAEMPIDQKTPIGILQNTKLTTREEDFEYKEIKWLFPEDAEGFLENIKPSYIVILEHLKSVYRNSSIDWTKQTMQNGLQSIMNLVLDAAQNLNKYFALFGKKIDFTKTEEFKALQDFYLNYISKKIPEKLEGKDAWTKEWEKNRDAEVLDYDKSGLKDFDSIAYDKEYDLFYIKGAEGENLFSNDLIRNIKLYSSFDEKIDMQNDLLIIVQKFKNTDMNHAAYQILHMLDNDIHMFYKYKFDHKNNKLAKCLNESFIALMLAANPKNIFKNNVKSCLRYFKDFQKFLRKVFTTKEYQKDASHTFKKESKKMKFLIKLVNKLCFTLFSRIGGVRQEVIGYIHRIIRKEKTKTELNEESFFWNNLMEDDDNLRKHLKKNHPLGPFVKLLELLEKEDSELCFDPIMQENIPEKLYEIKFNKNKVAFLHLPCPTKQQIINKALITEEYTAFLKELISTKKKHLYINLQNRTSYRENARCEAIENIQYTKEFKNILSVITLSKDSNFYNQMGEYLTVTSFDKFKRYLKKQLLENENSDYHIPKSKMIASFIDNLATLIHQTYFLEKKDLSKEERLNFIEIFYHFFILKMIEQEDPQIVSFSCKDALDVGSMVSASFFCFIKILTNSKWEKKDKDFLLWLFYAPTLLIRERAIESTMFIRHISCMALIDAHKDKIRKVFKKLYSKNFLDFIKIDYF